MLIFMQFFRVLPSFFSVMIILQKHEKDCFSFFYEINAKKIICFNRVMPNTFQTINALDISLFMLYKIQEIRHYS